MDPVTRYTKRERDLPPDPSDAVKDRPARRWRSAGALAERQQRIIGVIRDRPGCPVQYVATVLGLPYSTVRKEVRRLQYGGRIGSVRDGRTLHLVVRDEDTELTAVAHALLADERKRQVVEYLTREEPHRVTINQIADHIGAEFGFVKRVLENLDRLDMIRLVKGEHRYHIEERDGLSTILGVEQIRPQGHPID